MPPFPSVPNAVKLVMEGTYDEVGNYKWANVFHFSYTGAPPSYAQLESMAVAAFAGFVEAFSPLMPPSMSITSCTVTDLSSDMANEAEDVDLAPGTSTADKLPGNVCVLVSKPVARRYRGGHFRTYLACGTDENLQDQANWNEAFVGTVTDAYTSWVEAVVGSGTGGFVVTGEIGISYYQGVDPATKKPIRRDVPLVLPIVTSALSVPQEIASQRGRIGRRR